MVTPDLLIRSAEISDAPAVIELVTESRIQAYRGLDPEAGDQWESKLRETMSSPGTLATYEDDIAKSQRRPTHALFLVATEGDRTAGMIHVDTKIQEEGAVYWLQKIHTAEGTRGLGRRLMHAFVGDWRWYSPHVPSRLQVVQKNLQAIRFYEQFGYKIEPDGDVNRLGLSCYTMFRPATPKSAEL